MDQPAPPTRIELAIGGMSCAACAARLEKQLNKTPGVQNARVNFATERATLTAAPQVTPQILAGVVAKTGFTATPVTQPAPDDHGREALELAAAFALALPLWAGMVWPLPAWLALCLASLSQSWLAARFYRGAWASLRAGAANMDVLIALGTTAAYGLSLHNFLTTGPLYFDSAVSIIAFIRLGKFLESRIKRQTASALTGLKSLAPANAHLQGGGDIPAATLQPGQIIEIRPAERIPADGLITQGRALIDESLLTGESRPLAKSPGDALLAGALNLDGLLCLRVTARPGEHFIDHLARLVADAQAAKPPFQRLADRIATWFVPLVLALAALTFTGWWLHGAPPARALIVAVSVLVIACPCALGLATPAAILAATLAAAKRGIVLREPAALERAAKIDHMVFDKTGTLTTGALSLAKTECFAIPEPEALSLAAALAAANPHPLSAALRRPGIAAPPDFTLIPGQGVLGTIGGVSYLLGSAHLIPQAPPRPGATFLAREHGPTLAAFTFTDELRPHVPATLARLKTMGITPLILTGDTEAATRALGLDTALIASATPEQKLAAIRALQAQGHAVAMLGDGINDLAALAGADLALSLATATDAAQDSAALLLLRPDPALAAEALSLARAAWLVLWQGLAWALLYNVIAIPAAMAGLLSPGLAAAAMAASSLSVLGNALRLRH